MKLLVDGFTTKIARGHQELAVLVYPSAINLPSSTPRLLSRHPADRRHRLKTHWCRLSPGRRAPLALVHLRCGDTYQSLATAFGIGVAIVYRYIGEAVDVLASLAPTLKQGVDAVAIKAFVILDGILLSSDRLAADRPYFLGKHKKYGMNVQVITDPFGRLLWASPALRGALLDIKAARTHGIIDALTVAGIRCWADKGYREHAAPSESSTGAAGSSSPSARRPSTSRTRRSALSASSPWPPSDRPRRPRTGGTASIKGMK